jgi:phosphoglycolate phosphatase-like HAD superfamily hydrolase
MDRVIVFDFDGTLVDSRSAYVEMLTTAFKRYVPAVRTEEVAKNLIPTIKGTIEQLLMRYKRYNAKLVHQLEDTTIDLLSTRWLEYLKVTDDIVRLLDKLNNNGSTLYLASNSHSSFVLPAVEKFDLAKYFEDIITLDSAYKSKGEMLQGIVDKNSCAMESMTYIADTLLDIKIADELGCKLILLLTPSSWDYHKKRQLVKAANSKPIIKIAEGIPEAEELLLNGY